MIAAHSARQAGAPESVIEEMVAPWRARYGAHAVGTAFVQITEASNRLAQREIEAERRRMKR